MDKKDSTPWWMPSLILFFRLSGWIGIPVVGALYLGRWLDEKFGTEPWLFVSTVGAAFIITIAGLINESRAARKQLQEEEKNEKREEGNNER